MTLEEMQAHAHVIVPAWWVAFVGGPLLVGLITHRLVRRIIRDKE